ncbi:MAG: DUF58 domain-containing protein [Maricaulis sp.]|uniref:DUF58 domain-containing protein n=1 Tax=Maricaulis sp. TaxID=1486257 RepID=UPI00262D1FB2|nr:DUF58 domain-containing protein [Maricaulis sp.]MDM7984164.1 DUF58 domain-containing protein [Maricaulis sp.]
MRPTVRLLLVALGALAMTGVMIPLVEGWLALLPWLVLGGFLFADITASWRPGLRMRLIGANQIFASESRSLQLELSQPAPRGLSISIEWPEGISGPGDVRVEPGQTLSELTIHGRRRGRWSVGRTWPRWQSRFALIEFTPRIQLSFEITVLPDLRPITSGEIDVSVHTSLHGQKASFAEGEGSEFHQLRDYFPGESLRRVDWKRSARQRRLLSKETRAERNHNVIIALDCGYLMREEFAGLAKLDHAINAALSVAWAASVGGDKVGLFTYDSQPRNWLPPAAGRQAFPKLRRTLADVAYGDRESNHTLALATLNGSMKRRGLVIVFSDFVDTTTAELMLEQIGYMSKRHLVIFIALRDPETSALSRDAAQDLDIAAEAVAASDHARERKLVLERLHRLGVVVLDTEPGSLTPKLVSTYLDLKAREAA